MNRFFLLALAVLAVLSLPAVSQADILVGIDKDLGDQWDSVGEAFEQEFNTSVWFQGYAQNSMAQQIVLQSFAQRGKLHFVMVPRSWGSTLSRYLVDLSDLERSLVDRGAEVVYINQQPLGVEIPFAPDWFLGVLSWPDDFEIALEFLAFVAQGGSTEIGPVALSPLAAVAAFSTEKINKADHNPLFDGALEALMGAAQATVNSVASQMATAIPTFARTALESLATLYGVPFSATEATITVVLESQPGRNATNVAALGRLGVNENAIQATSKLIKITIPIGDLSALARQLTGVAFIRAPYTPFALGTPSEGVGAIGADAFHTAGIRGSGSKVAIIDLGFSGLSQAQSRGDLPYTVIQNDLTGTGLATGITHGTAVAEIVHDVAPEAELYLIKIADEVDLDLAVTYCLTNGIDIINHSLGWYNTNNYDGTGTIADIAQRAISGGILWVNAAGNSAENHWEGTFSDGNSDGWLDQNVTFYATAGSPIVLFLTWNEWPQSSTDYDLYLFDPSSTLVASSTKHQTGTEEPTESIQTTAPGSGQYTVRIQGVGTRSLELFNLYQTVSPVIAASSILAPANAANVIAVGAVDHSQYTTGPIQPYSSQGPSNDGRTKPDLVAPDNVATGTSPYAPFPGTSGAAPHVSGAAALLLSQSPGLSEFALRTEVLSQTIAMGSANVFGNGRLSLQAPAGANTPPTASYTYSPNFPTAGSSVSFNASASSDPDGSIVLYEWDFTGNGVTDATGLAQARAFSAGTHAVRLTVTDNNATTDTQVQYIVVSATANQPPNAAFTVSPSSGLPGTWFTFSATGSNDPDGSIAGYAWNFGDGNTGSGITAYNNYAAAGVYTVQLTVTDNDGATDTYSQPLVVTAAANQPPNAAFTVSPSSGLPGTWFTFSASGSTDPDGSIASYFWNFGDGNTDSGVTAYNNYAAAGVYTVQLTVTDNDGATDTYSQPLVVTAAANQPPNAVFTVSPSSGQPGDWFTFSASGSTDPDGSIASYFWNFGDGNTDSGVTAYNNYTAAGVYTVQLTVTDNDGSTDTTTMPVSVQAASAPDLVVQSITYVPGAPVLGQSVTFSITVVNQGNATTGFFRVRLAGSSSSTQSYITQLPAGASQVVSLSLPLTANSETFTATADDLNQVTESSETNNVNTVLVSAAAIPLVAEAGGPYSGTSGSPIAFSGAASTGPITTYVWSFGDGASAQGVSTSHSYANPGTYTATLTVYSGGQQSVDTAQVSVSAPQPALAAQLSLPKAVYEIDDVLQITYSVNRAAYVYLCDVTADGHVTLLFPNWLEPSAYVGSGAHTFPGASGYTLRISEPVGTETLYMFAASGPIASFPTSLPAGAFSLLSTNPTSFRNAVLAMMQSQFATSAWAFDSLSFEVVSPTPTTGTIRVLSNPTNGLVRIDSVAVGNTTHDQTNVSPGIHTVEVSKSGYQTATTQVTVTAGLTSTVTLTLTAIPTNAPPVANFGYSPVGPVVGDTVSFDASASTDSDGSISSYAWNFGDGTTGSGQFATHAFSTTGSFTVTLTVTDNDSAQSSTSVVVPVGSTADIGWISPVSFEDPAANWVVEQRAFDDDIDTNYNSNAQYYDHPAGEWTSFIILNAPGGGIQSDRIRVLVGDQLRNYNVLSWDIDVYRDGAWVDVYMGTEGSLSEHNPDTPGHTWIEFAFDQGLVTRMRLRAYNNNDGGTALARIWEADFHEATAP
jgi:PKD repeat protein